MNLGLMLLIVVLLDYKIGDPHNWPHPIILVGKWINVQERFLRKIGMDNRVGGVILWLGTMVATVGVLTALLYLGGLIHPYIETGLTIYFLFAALAATSLKTEVMKVSQSLEDGDLKEGRQGLSWLVGRDTETLTVDQVIKGAVETVAENTIDGVLAPLFFIIIGMFLGCPVQVVFLYKAVNTLDSMVGYIQEPYKRIGWFSAKVDDLFNLIPARLVSLLMLLAGGVLSLDLYNCKKVWPRDRNNHKSPNAGWPESVVAGLLDIQLGGSHRYFGQVLEKPTIGDPISLNEVKDILETIRIMDMCVFILFT